MRPYERQLASLILLFVASWSVLLAYFFIPWPRRPVVFTNGTIPSRTAAAVRSDHSTPPPPSFVDVTHSSGINHDHYIAAALTDIRQAMSPGVGLADFDGDGRVDVFLVGPSKPRAGETSGGSRLFLNRGEFTFEQVKGAGGAWSGEAGMGCVIADYDGDSDADIYVTALGPNRLYRNDGSGRFEEVAASAGVAVGRWSGGAALADYDLDGDLDLYVTNYVRYDAAKFADGHKRAVDRSEPPSFVPYHFDAEDDVFYRNNGDGTFEDATAAAGLNGAGGKGLGVLFADVSDDGRADLLVINDVSANKFWMNASDGSFVDRSVISGLNDARSGMGVALGDYDNDGAFDVFSTHWQDESNVLYRNIGFVADIGSPLFEDVTVAAGLASPSLGATGWGTTWADFDQDGLLDLLVVNGYTSPSASDATRCIGQRAMLFIQRNGRFVELGAALGVSTSSRWSYRGAACADLDGDGDLDIVMTANHGPVQVFENQFATGQWLHVVPTGPSAIGTVVRVTCDDRTQQRMILAGTSYLSCEPPVAHFGLGTCPKVNRIEVVWPNGAVTTLRNVSADQVITVEPT